MGAGCSIVHVTEEKVSLNMYIYIYMTEREHRLEGIKHSCVIDVAVYRVGKLMTSIH